MKICQKSEWKCKHCGKSFYTVPSKRPVYCSRSCYDASDDASVRGKLLGKKRLKNPEPIEMRCKQCNKSFYVPTYNKSRKFCSQICNGLSRVKIRIPKIPKIRIPRKIHKLCLNCNKQFIVSMSKKTQRYCCTHCACSDPSRIENWKKNALISVLKGGPWAKEYCLTNNYTFKIITESDINL